MSADNGVYILVTAGPEYRVIYAQGIDNIYEPFDDVTAHYPADPEMIKSYFKDAQVFTEKKEALNYAFSLADQHSELEYGVCTLREWDHKTFEELTTSGN